MNVFADYSQYYDLLYQDKDYQGEADYIYSLIKQFSPNSSSVLELGCGTGKHACLLAEKGLHIHGVDMSNQMLDMGKHQLGKLSDEISDRVSLDQGDVRTYRTAKKFDVCISLFHVMSYQTSNDDLQSVFQTAAAHLNPGGVFIFDYWYGASVLTERPEVRVRRMENNKIEVMRVAEPIMYPNKNIVRVNYTVDIVNKKDGAFQRVEESHDMRYLFLPEVEYISQPEFSIIGHYGWMKDALPTLSDWAGISILKNKS